MNNNFKDQLLAFHTAPFLFVGSGLSRRYLGLEDWKGLLELFAVQPYKRYEDKAASNMPNTSTLVAKDFVDMWWSEEVFEESRKEYDQYDISQRSELLPFKFEVAKYFASIDINYQLSKLNEPLQKELDALKNAVIDGIITTNYDFLLEYLFEYKPFIGQEEMLFGQTVGMGEIYKIHGCASQFNSIVITSEDYVDFNKRNPYLASKLLSIFIDHPIIFIGYSLEDSNIKMILQALINALGPINSKKLSERMYFIQWEESKDIPEFTHHSIQLDEGMISTTAIYTNSFLPIFEVLGEIQRKIPTKIMRLIKEELYTLISSTEPTTKIAVLNAENINSRDDIEFVIGVGVANQERGYSCIGMKEIIEDIIFVDKAYDPNEIISTTLMKIKGTTTRGVIPIFKYLQAVGITNQSEYIAGKSLIPQKLQEVINKSINEYKMGSIPSSLNNFYDVIDGSQSISTKMAYLTHFAIDSANKDHLLAFLKANFKEHADESHYQRLVAIYDRLEYGW